MRIKNILISQPSPISESSPYVQLSKREKINIDFRPFIEIQGVSASEVRKQKIDFSHFTSIIFTSKNAVDHYFRLAEQMRFKVPDVMRYFCQSKVVAYYLQKYIVFRKRNIYIGNTDFIDLIPFIKKYSQEKFLLPSSNILKTQISQTLKKFKVKWKRAILYRTISSDLSDLKNISYDILVFFTPSGIKSLFENFPNFKQNGTRIAAFGKSTINLASKSGLKIDIRVPTPETPSMAMALEQYLKQKQR